MQPTNRRPIIRLADGEGVRCRLMARADAPVFWEECETMATDELTLDQVERFNAWRDAHPRAIIRINSGWGHLCEVHYQHVLEIVGP